jgi:hypothetical protein
MTLQKIIKLRDRRVERGAVTFHPLVGELVCKGELIKLGACHPGVAHSCSLEAHVPVIRQDTAHRVHVESGAELLSDENSPHLWNPKVHCRIHINPVLHCFASYWDPVHIPIS